MPKTPEALSSSRKKRILIVEDEPDLLEVLSLLLQEAGYEVNPAEHALAAIFAAVRAAPDLILVDIRMPIMNGLELVRELRTHRDTCHFRIVALTGYDTPENRAAAKKAGCDGYLTKPIEPGRFLAQVAEFLARPDRSPIGI